MLRWGAPGLIVTLLISYMVFLGSVRKDPAALNEDGSVEGLTSILSRDITEEMVRFHFEDVTISAGITFRHFPDVRQSMLPEDMGSGASWGDYDNDGDLDLLLVNFKGSIVEGDETIPEPGRCALYRNDGDGTFTDVSKEAGLDVAVFGLAGAWGDFDNDDDLDLYLSNYGPNLLFENNGDGTFTDITEAAGVGDDAFGAGATWNDYNADGLIDLYVCNYVQFVRRKSDLRRKTRQYASEIPYTINPSSYKPESNRLYRNNGDGTFTDVAREAGVDNPTGRSLGAVWFDFDLDGLVDLYVANDVSSNGVFHNMGDGTFADIGASSLAADYRGAMGLAVGDYEQDGDFDLFVTHWISQENAFFENMASEDWSDDEGKPRIVFMDNAEVLGLGQISLSMVGWATSLVDFDNDGHLDMWVVNGNTLEQPEDTTLIKPQLAQLFWHDPGEGFFEIAAYACERLQEPFVGRGGAHGDYDGDGRIDLIMMAHGGTPRLLRNVTENKNHWLTLRLRQTGGAFGGASGGVSGGASGGGGNTRALGALVTVKSGNISQIMQVGADGTYLSQNQLDLHFGLGDATHATEVIIRWPDGVEERLENLEADKVHTLIHEANYR